MPTSLENAANRAYNIAHSANTRNIIFLIISVISILLLNSLLPIIEGTAHYTEAPEEVTYAEYIIMVQNNKNYSLTYTSKKAIDNYIDAYCEEHPEVTVEQRVDLVPPPTFKVTVYTKFFFNYIYWWISTATHIVSVLLLYYSVFNYLLSKRKTTHKQYNDIKDEVEDAVNTKLDPVTFEPWMLNIFNKERRIKQHKANVNFYLERLQQRTSYKVRHADESNRKYRAYKLKYDTLQEQLTDEYVDKYVENKRVKGFKFIYPTFVTSGYNVIGTSTDSYSLIKSDAKKLNNDGVRKVATSILLTTVFAILLTFTAEASMDKPWYWILLNIVVKLAPMLLQIPLAYDYCESFMEDQLITNLISRRNIALLYLADSRKETINASTNTEADRPTNPIGFSIGDTEQSYSVPT